MGKEEIIKYFRKNGNKPSTTKEIGKATKISQASISRSIKRMEGDLKSFKSYKLATFEINGKIRTSKVPQILYKLLI